MKAHKTRKRTQRLTLSTETLHRLSEETLKKVDGGAPTQGVPCTFSEPSQCATCLCTV